eukprot:UN02562
MKVNLQNGKIFSPFYRHQRKLLQRRVHNQRQRSSQSLDDPISKIRPQRYT